MTGNVQEEPMFLFSISRILFVLILFVKYPYESQSWRYRIETILLSNFFLLVAGNELCAAALR